MKTDIETLKQSFWLGYDSFETSRLESRHIWNLYHNRQWTAAELNTLERRGQPKETFNVIKLFARMVIGYYSTVVNTVKAEPTKAADQTMASLLTDVISNVFEQNNMNVAGDNIKLSALISGLMISTVQPEYTGERDKFGRPLYRIKLGHVSDQEIVLDPKSSAEDYSDARFMHRFKWITREVVVSAFGTEKADMLQAHYDELTDGYMTPEGTMLGDTNYRGRYNMFDNYLIVHTVVEDDNKRRWSIFWCGDVELKRTEITYREVRWPYRVQKLHTSDLAEYYGIFREVAESQRAINQALIKLQLMANTQKIFAEEGAVADFDKFRDQVNRVNGVVKVKSLKGIKVENLNAQAIEQYQIIDRAFDRIQRMLSINDSFLGMAFASDSGRKVKLQQNATIMALRYITVRVESFYELLGRDVANLVKQYYTANQVMRVTDELVGNRFIELNKPIEIWSGEFDDQGQPIYDTAYEMVLNPETNEPEEDDDGNLIIAPINEETTEVQFLNTDIKVRAAVYNDEDERTQLMIENVLAGNIGQLMAQVNPAGFFKIAGLTLRTMKTKYGPEISKVFEETAEMLSGNPEQEEAAAILAGGMPNQRAAKSSELKLPTNTNEAPL
jgi:hypothetical protein